MRRHTRLAAAACTVAALAATFALTACSSSDVPEAAEVPAGEHQGPLMKYLAPVVAVLSGEEASIALNTTTQEAIASCMAESGFDYVPYVAPFRVSVPASDAGTRGWVARRGYDLSGGVVEGPELEALASADAATAALPPSIDPNVAIYAALSAGTRAAYDLALAGPGFTEEDLAGETAREWTRADGCILWASGQDTGQPNAHLNDYVDLMDRMTIADRSVDSHPRMADLTIEWAHCMADAGHVYTSPTDAWESVYAVINGTRGPDGDPVDPDVTSDEAKALEIAVALADYDCKEALAWEEVRNTVVDEIEAQFLTDNKAELDEFIAAVLEGQP